MIQWMVNPNHQIVDGHSQLEVLLDRHVGIRVVKKAFVMSHRYKVVPQFVAALEQMVDVYGRYVGLVCF